jgi:hypothetical protein
MVIPAWWDGMKSTGFDDWQAHMGEARSSRAADRASWQSIKGLGLCGAQRNAGLRRCCKSDGAGSDHKSDGQ